MQGPGNEVMLGRHPNPKRSPILKMSASDKHLNTRPFAALQGLDQTILSEW